MKDIRVASIQFQHRPGEKEANLAVVRSFVERAAAQNVEIAVFPECCLSGYWHLRRLSREELVALAEPIPRGPCSRELLDLSKKYQMTIGAGLVEVAEDGTLYNSYLVAMPGGEWRRHRKIHCFVSEHMASGSEFTVFDTPHGCRVGVLICYDNNIGENVRINALLGAEVLLAPHQTGGCDTGSVHAMGLIDPALWENRHADPAALAALEAEIRGDKGRGWLLRWLPARAHDNGIFLIFSNGVGADDGEVRTGNSMVIDPYGRVIRETCKAGDDLVVADLDASLRDRATGRRWIRSRRPELYKLIATSTGMEQETRAVRFDFKGGKAV